jgi:hypothetical protein
VQSFLIGFSDNVVSAIVIAVVPLSIIVAMSNRRQRQIASFFGLSPNARMIHIFLSRYQPTVVPEPLAGGAFSKGYTNETVAVDEFQGAQAIGALFDSKWVVASVSSIMSEYLMGRRDFGRVEVHVNTVPKRPTYPGGESTVILMGTGAKESNGLAEELLSGTSAHSVFRFIKDSEEGRAFERMAVRGFSLERFYAVSYQPRELAVLQRVTMSNGRVVFLCAGKDVSGSRMAAELLSENWLSLHNYYSGRDNGDFARLYAFDGSYKNSEILCAIP